MVTRSVYMKAIYVVRGSTPGTVYDVEVDPHGNWFCTCPSYIHRGQYLPVPGCKHTLAKQAELLAKEVAAAVKAPSPVGRTRLEQIFE